VSIERIKNGRRRKHMKQDGGRSRIGHRKRGYVMNIGNGNKLAGAVSLLRRERSSFYSVFICLFMVYLIILLISHDKWRRMIG